MKMLNGGFPAWLNKKQATTKKPTLLTASDYIPRVEPKRLASLFTMQLATKDSSKLIIDVRTPNEYSGKESKSTRNGHIPTAKNIPLELNFETIDGVKLLKSDKELKALYSGSEDKKTYTYCNKGTSSSMTYTILRHLGYDVSVYDGSWHEWGNKLSLPIETGL